MSIVPNSVHYKVAGKCKLQIFNSEMEKVGTKMKIILGLCNIFIFSSCLWPITLPNKYSSRKGNILHKALK